MSYQGLTRFAELKGRYQLETATRAVANPLPAGEVVRFPLQVDPSDIATAVAEVERNYQPRSFASDRDNSYESLSLSFNPAIPGDPHHSTLGSTALTPAEHFYATPQTIAKVGAVRNSYYDTYGFRLPTPAARLELGFLTSRLQRSLIRSRLSIVRAGQPAPASFGWGWHKDETVFENLRINIHVTDSDLHRIQIMREDRMPLHPGDPALADHRFDVGYGYSWDTHLPHRACAIGVPSYDRAAIILGVSPWFDYDADADEWEPNQFFGRKHPLAMLMDGDVL